MDLMVVGYRKVSYTSKKTGLLVEGVKLYCECNSVKNVFGIYVEEIYLPNSKLDYPLEDILGRKIEVLYNRFGSVERVIVS